MLTCKAYIYEYIVNRTATGCHTARVVCNIGQPIGREHHGMLLSLHLCVLQTFKQEMLPFLCNDCKFVWCFAKPVCHQGAVRASAEPLHASTWTLPVPLTSGDPVHRIHTRGAAPRGDHHRPGRRPARR